MGDSSERHYLLLRSKTIKTIWRLLRYIHHHHFFVLGLVLVIVGASIYLWLNRRRLRERFGPKRANSLIKMAFMLSLGLSIGYGFYYYSFHFEPKWIKVEEVTIRDEALSKALSGLKVVQLSDLHIDFPGSREKRLISLMNQMKPDLIFITGDFVNSIHYLPGCVQVLKQIKARYGIWAVIGNCDGYTRKGYIRLDKTFLQETGVNLLLNEVKELQFKGRSPFLLLGLRSSRYGLQPFSGKIQGKPELPLILLSHFPCWPSQAGQHLQARVNLILSGHTHGGQIGLPFFDKLCRKMLQIDESMPLSGLSQREGAYLYINRGLGTNPLGVRFLCRPEVTLFRFEQ